MPAKMSSAGGMRFPFEPTLHFPSRPLEHQGIYVIETQIQGIKFLYSMEGWGLCHDCHNVHVFFDIYLWFHVGRRSIVPVI